MSDFGLGRKSAARRGLCGTTRAASNRPTRVGTQPSCVSGHERCGHSPAARCCQPCIDYDSHDAHSGQQEAGGCGGEQRGKDSPRGHNSTAGGACDAEALPGQLLLDSWPLCRPVTHEWDLRHESSGLSGCGYAYEHDGGQREGQGMGDMRLTGEDGKLSLL